MNAVRPARRGWLSLLPIGLFALLAAAFYGGLGIDSKVLPSALIDQPAPQFALPPLNEGEPGFATSDLQGHVSLVNTFASWCAPCRAEHRVLTALTATKRVPIYGIDYKDKTEAAQAWLAGAAIDAQAHGEIAGRPVSVREIT